VAAFNADIGGNRLLGVVGDNTNNGGGCLLRYLWRRLLRYFWRTFNSDIPGNRLLRVVGENTNNGGGRLLRYFPWTFNAGIGGV